MLAKEYWDLKKKHEQEIQDFPIAFAFSDKQLEEALEKLGADDISECRTVLHQGDIVKKEDAESLMQMLYRHTEEIIALIRSDEKIAYETFLSEMDNHEYAINWDGDDDVLGCLGMCYKDLKEYGLVDIYNSARREHLRKAHEEWELI